MQFKQGVICVSIPELYFQPHNSAAHKMKLIRRDEKLERVKWIRHDETLRKGQQPMNKVHDTEVRKVLPLASDHGRESSEQDSSTMNN